MEPENIISQIFSLIAVNDFSYVSPQYTLLNLIMSL